LDDISSIFGRATSVFRAPNVFPGRANLVVAFTTIAESGPKMALFPRAWVKEAPSPVQGMVGLG
jgi:hypothetical protein